MNIVTSYFLVKRVAGSMFIGEASLRHRTVRQQEYLECIRRNAEHREVESLHILIEGQQAYDHFRDHVMQNNNFFPSPTLRRKIIPVLWPEKQPTYADMFQHANRLLRGKLTMICNADVYLSLDGASVSSLQPLFTSLHTSHRVALALTRYESEKRWDAPLIYDYRGSHDAFILSPPLPHSFIESVQHPQNCYKAENVVLHELQRHGYKVVNPCLSFMLIHKHEAELRQWLPPVDEERYAKAPPCTIKEAIDMIKKKKLGK
ncbi:uncharacterized protein TM35_000132750 [Trypanosoma theileri]|uniref:Uncharacterized protein n=1 Tax=Trypanosoma theileri TaxID=67003 RepID=A0A1X0NXD8_9TRYP|nr:uncharacterized protein TM35_000132750 [Trypanosoma theileri]ORC89271.1 hypothetical protein TM35_000132750 [Trypanosoma theileri]